MPLRTLSRAEQVAAFLRGEVVMGRWGGEMPGIISLEAELGVNRNTVLAALRLLEQERLLVAQGLGRPRRIVQPENAAPPSMRLSILLYERSDRQMHYMVELVHALQVAGHKVEFARKTLRDLRMDAARVARYVRGSEADAWVVKSGPSDILEWFAGHEKPAFALFGRRRRLPLASSGPDKSQALVDAVRRLAQLGHRRIVMLVREERRKPERGHLEQVFLDELGALGMPSGAFNLPDWDDSPAGLQRCLDGLFRLTPPSALLIDEAPLFLATQHELARRGIVAPGDISMVCSDSDPAFDWFRPEVSHIRWESAPVVRRVVEWANDVARGRDHRRKCLTKAVFVEGGTTGPPRR